jgi:hypothetical protein
MKGECNAGEGGGYRVQGGGRRTGFPDGVRWACSSDLMGLDSTSAFVGMLRSGNKPDRTQDRFDECLALNAQIEIPGGVM